MFSSFTFLILDQFISVQFHHNAKHNYYVNIGLWVSLNTKNLFLLILNLNSDTHGYP